MLWEFALTSFVTLFVVVDPIGLMPSFMATTHNLPSSTHKSVGIRAILISALILIGTALGGNWLLSRLGITLPAFRISGGFLLFAVASEMVLGVRSGREARQAEQAIEDETQNVAAFPLAIPLIAGPGAITATILIAGNATEPQLFLILVGAIALVLTICAAAFFLATRLSRALGGTSHVVVSKLLGIVLAALAVQFVIDGIRTAFGID